MKKYAALIVIGVCLTGAVFSLLVQRKVVGMQCFRTVTMRSALRSKGIKCRIMTVPIGEQGDTQLR